MTSFLNVGQRSIQSGRFFHSRRLAACPGQRRSLAECTYITVRLLQSTSRVESRDDRPFEEFLKTTV
jgi:hypothetical protein